MHCIIVGEWITESEKQNHLLYILSGGLIKTFSIYFIHTLTIDRLIACLWRWRTYFIRRLFINASLPAIPRASALSIHILL